MAEMWGTAAGSRLAEQDNMAREINKLQIKQTMGQLAAQPVLARKLEAETQAAELAVGQAKRRDALRQKMEADRQANTAAGQGIDQMKVLKDQFANEAAVLGGSGYIEESLEILKGLTSMNASESASRNSIANAKIHEAKLERDQADYFLNILSSVRDQESLNAAVERVEKETGEKSALRGEDGNIVTYSPGLTDGISRELMNAKQRIDVEMQEMRDKGAKESRDAENKLRVKREGLVTAQTKLADERRAALKRDAGNPNLASARLVTAIKSKINIAFGYRMVEDELNDFALPVAERAADIMHTNRSVTESEAANRAFAEVMKENRGTLGKYKMKGMPSETEIAEQQALTTKHLRQYDPNYEYKETERGLERALREGLPYGR